MKKLFFSIIFVLVSLTASVSANTEEVKGDDWCCIDVPLYGITSCSPYGCYDAAIGAAEMIAIMDQNGYQPGG
ncbi:MAG: hypothetical protein ACFCUI_11170 [Bernardetiaceae bacterium]